MNISKKTIWQQAAGDKDRHYADTCLKWDVILNGPGYAGQWPDCAPMLSEANWSKRKVTDLRRFAEKMLEGDLIVLRMGTDSVLAVGEVVGPYQWHADFGDIDGWDLQHVRRVRWLWDGLSIPKMFPTYSLKQGDTTQILSEGAVTEWLSTLKIPESAFSRSLATLEEIEQDSEISVDEISEFLFDKGVASASITALLSEIGELTRIAKWYERSTKPSEHETVAYLVVPLLRALGWTPQRMAVEWHYVDVALFDRLPREDQTLRVVVEVKKMGSACLSARSQAAAYAVGKKECHRLIVTDGLRYGVYVKGPSGEFHLYAYLNLTRLRNNYTALECNGAEDALLAMAPEWKYTDA